MNNEALPEDERRRYARHLMLPEVGVKGQQRLAASRVLCVGAGGLGSPVLMYLAAAGVGHLGIVDDDRVDVSNLQRQIIHQTGDTGRPKVESARDAIRRLNPHVQVTIHEVRFSSHNAPHLLKDYEIVVDGSDNFSTRYLVNDACVLHRLPCVYGSVQRFEGQASVFAPHEGGPCYRCLYPQPPPPWAAPNCAEAGVLGVMPGLVGLVQATEVIKWCLRQGRSLVGRLLVIDALGMTFREIKVRPDPQCPLCGDTPTITALTGDYRFDRADCAESGGLVSEVSVHELKQAMGCVNAGIRVIDIREPHELTLARIEGMECIPMSRMGDAVAALDPHQPLYLICHHGVRSLHLAKVLSRQGFQSVKSVRGGIDAWSRDVDPAVPRY